LALSVTAIKQSSEDVLVLSSGCDYSIGPLETKRNPTLCPCHDQAGPDREKNKGRETMENKN
jgi:hypothetical protein